MNRKLKSTELNRLTPEGFKSADKIPVSVILDDIRSMNNIGSVFRTADAFLVQKIYLCGITAQPPHRDIQKTALGATETVEWEYHQDVSVLIEQLKKEGKKVYAVEQAEKTISLEHVIPDASSEHVLVFGNEVKGVKQTVIDIADGCVEVPQLGTKHSLNISVCAGVVLWKYFEALALSSKRH